MTTFSQLGKEIRALRKAKGWSQAQLAQYAQLDRTTVGALERDNYSDIGIRKVQRIAELLGKSLTLKPLILPTLDDLQAENAQEREERREKK